MSVKKRIKEFVSDQNIPISAFEKSISASNGYVNSINKSIGLDKLELILEQYPKISLDWLFTGKGEMYKVESLSDDDVIEYAKPNAVRKTKSSTELIPVYDVDFIAGNLETFEDASITPERYMDIPEFSGCTAFRAYSDSMENLIKSGAILFGKKVQNWLEHLEYGQIYGIITTDGRRYLKYIRKAENHLKHFLLRSENENYDDFHIPKKSIRSIWLIDGWINKRT